MYQGLLQALSTLDGEMWFPSLGSSVSSSRRERTFMMEQNGGYLLSPYGSHMGRPHAQLSQSPGNSCVLGSVCISEVRRDQPEALQGGLSKAAVSGQNSIEINDGGTRAGGARACGPENLLLPSAQRALPHHLPSQLLSLQLSVGLFLSPGNLP